MSKSALKGGGDLVEWAVDIRIVAWSSGVGLGEWWWIPVGLSASGVEGRNVRHLGVGVIVRVRNGRDAITLVRVEDWLRIEKLSALQMASYDRYLVGVVEC